MYLRSVVTVEDLLDLAVSVEFAGYCPLAMARIAPGLYRLFQERTCRWHTLTHHWHRQARRGPAGSGDGARGDVHAHGLRAQGGGEQHVLAGAAVRVGQPPGQQGAVGQAGERRLRSADVPRRGRAPGAYTVSS
jgi:hypothetical protein